MNVGPGLRLVMWVSGILIVDFEEFANKVEEMRAEGATKPILEVLVSPVGLRCAVLALGED